MALEQTTAAAMTAAGLHKYRDYGRIELWTGLTSDGSSVYKAFDAAAGRAWDWTAGIDTDKQASVLFGLAVAIVELTARPELGLSTGVKNAFRDGIFNLF